ncbi:MAG: pseudaminic acid biosynthesis-associated methylase [Deltaproteobacteria bacterium]|nr:pseudaminic acid biosynthesis-associated methylase [Deltaproteobacteria bacterium]
MFKTEQESFWAGAFGDDYIDRNKGEKLYAGNLALFSEIIKRTTNIRSVLEIGANVGMNLMAISQLLPEAEMSGIEINDKASEILKGKINGKVYCTSIVEYVVDYQRDLVLSKGVLIHINPDELPKTYDLMYDASRKYICIAEYYNPSPVSINYRGHDNKLFKRDFAGDLMQRHKDLILVDYGFAYHKDNNFSQDDITWFLLRK